MFNSSITLNGTEYYIPASYFNKKVRRNARLSIATSGMEHWIVKNETEDEVLISQDSPFNKAVFYVPKSVLVTEDPADDYEKDSVFQERMKDTYDYYLRQVAKDLAVKLGNLKKWDKIVAKINSSNYYVMTFDEFKSRAIA